ncbi:MAG: Sensor histidine kinase LiaS [Luteibacter sp.]|nr:MAG: Sensor histidine kinase LiaS [Luteibacter sp.]
MKVARPDGERGSTPRRVSAYVRARLGALLLLLAWPVFALDTTRPVDSLLHTAFHHAQGAPVGVAAIAQTDDGQIWFSTRDGLYRYDGFDFTRVELLPQGAAQTSATWALYAADGGDLWVALANGGVARLTDGAITRYGVASGLPAGLAIDAFSTDGDGRLWANGRGVLVYFDNGVWKTPSSEWNVPAHVDGLFEDGRGDIWIGADERIYVLRAGHRRFEPVDMRFSHGFQLLVGADGRLWLSDERGITAMPGEWGKPHARAPARRANGLDTLIDRDGALWTIDCHSGLCRDPTFGKRAPAFLSRAALRAQSAGTALGLSSELTMTAMVDREGNLWLGSKGGVDLFRDSLFARERFPDPNVYFALAEDGAGKLWVGTDNNSDTPDRLWRIDRANVPPTALPGFQAPVSAAWTDRDGTVWLGGHGHLWHLKDGTPVTESFPASPTGVPGVVHAMARDAAGRFWLAVSGQGLYVRDANDAWQPSSSIPGMPTGSPSAICAMDDGRLWFGYPDGALVRLAGDRIDVQVHPGKAAAGPITALATVGSRLLVASERAFSVLDGGRAVFLSTSPAHVLEGATGIARDGRGTWWINTDDGVARVGQDALTDAMDDEARHLDLELLTEDDGLPGGAQRVRPLPTALAARDGTLWFAAEEGLASLDPGRVGVAPSPPAAVIREIVAGDVSFPVRDAQLDPDHREITVRYAAIAPSRPNGVRFRYRLTPGQVHWRTLEGQRELRYTQMHPGTYVLDVQASYNGRDWGEPAEATLVVLPTFVEGPWFKLLCAVAILLTGWIVHRLRVRWLTRQLRIRLRERYDERERIARELHDTLLQGAQGLILRFQTIVDRLAGDDPGRRQLEQALDRAERLVVEGRDRVQHLRERHGHAGTLAERLQRYAEELEEAGIQVAMHTRGEAAPLDPFAEDEFYCIGREALRNVQRHADAGSVYVEMIYGASRFTLLISDDGKGMDESSDAPTRHWGLIGISERAHRIGGRASIRTKKGQGTELMVEAPADKVYRRGKRPRGG